MKEITINRKCLETYLNAGSLRSKGNDIPNVAMYSMKSPINLFSNDEVLSFFTQDLINSPISGQLQIFTFFLRLLNF